jgi:hypothetical protein
MDIDPVLKRLEVVERRGDEFARGIGELRDAVIVTAEVQRRQAEVQRMQPEGLRQFDEAVARFGLKLDEFGDKLNGLIDYIDNMPRQKPPN